MSQSETSVRSWPCARCGLVLPVGCLLCSGCEIAFRGSSLASLGRSSSQASTGSCTGSPDTSQKAKSSPHRIETSPSACHCCGTPLDSGDLCSRRCQWFMGLQCLQCGRARPNPRQLYCNIACSSQAQQANWCPSCGVRQVPVGATHCSEVCKMKMHDNMATRPRRKVALQLNTLTHEVIMDREKQQVLHGLRSQFANLGLSVVNVIKCSAHTLRRKEYLNYRSAVEQRMVELKAAKYGYGGEGNEQKRYVSLSIECTLGEAGNPFCKLGAKATTCSQPGCYACAALRFGLNLERLNAASHYCATEISLCLRESSFLNPSALKAVGICRAVLGVPQFVADHTQIDSSPAENFHSVVISDGDIRNDGTYLFRDDAIELQYIVLFC